MCVVGYLASGAAETQSPRAWGVDSIGIKWSGEVLSERIGVTEAGAPELKAQEFPETVRRPLGWK
jgi:hypothetical protein